jgi:hypothetical protein
MIIAGPEGVARDRGYDKEIIKRRSRIVGGDSQDTKYQKVEMHLVQLNFKNSKMFVTDVMKSYRADTDEMLQIVL